MSETNDTTGVDTSTQTPADSGTGQATAAEPQTLISSATGGDAGNGDAVQSAVQGGAGQPASGTGETKAEGADGKEPADDQQKKSGEDEKPKNAPEEYAAFNTPEGVEIAEPAVEQFKGVAKELDLSQEQAQGLIDKMTPWMQQRTIENIKRTSNEWAERSRQDPEIGGENFARSMANVARLRDNFAKNADGTFDKDIAEFMNSPMGNHPGALKLLARAGAAFGEARYPTGGAAKSGPYTAKDFYADAKNGDINIGTK